MLYPQPTLFTGACRSGKSALAQAWCERRTGLKVYVATAEIRDAEMADRVSRHKAARGSEWLTVEQAGHQELVQVLRDLPANTGAALVDCTCLWLAELMEQGLDDGHILERIEELTALFPSLVFPLALVHNETGWGLVPEYPLGRRFRDLSGMMGQRLATACGTVILTVCGLPLILKGKLD